MSEFPSGTITFLFTDIEGSTRLLHELGPQSYAAALAEHHRALRKAFVAHDGVEGDTQGDAFFVAFQTAPAAVAAASELTDALAGGPIRVRVGIHTGTAFLAEEGYVGVDVNRAARIAACGHGGQILISAATASLLDANALRDLGEHRLKDLISPERIYQLEGENFPPLRSLHQTNLPIPSTPFLGRERELGEVLGLLSQPDIRLLTLIGPGGMGKTRLGLQAAGGLAGSYADGVWWVPLAPLRDSELVLEQASHALGAKDGLAEHIGNRSMLLFFDNFEQVVEAGSEIAALLTFCPKLDLLVTSREPLHVTGEQEYQVLPLVPTDAVGLFVARARAIEPDFETDDSVAEICRRLDDLPLALELAAARVKALSTEQILSRLEQRLPLLTGGARDLPERQRTLRATIHWSHELLTPEEQLLFARLAVFAGGCSLAAAEEVAAADLDILQSLVDKSLVRFTECRYWMLETIREYAAELLEACEDAEEARNAHAAWFTSLAAQAELRGPEHAVWLERLRAEHANLRAALAWHRTRGRSAEQLRLACLLGEYTYHSGALLEGRGWLDDALAHADDAPPELRARGLAFSGMSAALAGDLPAGARSAEAGLALARECDDPDTLAEALRALGFVRQKQGDADAADRLNDEAVDVARANRLDALLADLANNLGCSALGKGDAARAESLFSEAITAGRARNDAIILGTALSNLALLEYGRAAHERAAACWAEALRIARDNSLGPASMCALLGAEVLMAHAGSPEPAARVHGAVDQLMAETGERLSPLERRLRDAAFREIQEKLGGSETERAVLAGRDDGSELVSGETLRWLEAFTVPQRTA